MRTVEIPGGTARLREKGELRVRDRRLIEAATLAASGAYSKLESSTGGMKDPDELLQAGISRSDWEVLKEVQDAKIVAALVDWTLPVPLPNMGTIGDLEDEEVWAALAAATKGTDKAGADFSPSDPNDPEFKDSPTPRSDAFEGGSSADRESPSTDSKSSTGMSTDTGSPSPE